MRSVDHSSKYCNRQGAYCIRRAIPAVDTNFSAVEPLFVDPLAGFFQRWFVDSKILHGEKPTSVP